MRGFDFDISEVKKAEGMDGRPNLQLISPLNFILTTMNTKGLLADLFRKKTKQNKTKHVNTQQKLILSTPPNRL